MQRILGSCLAAGFVLGCADSSVAPDPSRAGLAGPELAPAQALTINTTYPLSFWYFIPCANGGAGEDVLFEGALHEVLHVTQTAKGRAIIVSHFEPRGIWGTGQITGTRYKGAGATQNVQTLGLGETTMRVNSFLLVGQGPGSNLSIHENFHLTLNPNGTVTSSHDTFRAGCG